MTPLVSATAAYYRFGRNYKLIAQEAQDTLEDTLIHLLDSGEELFGNKELMRFVRDKCRKLEIHGKVENVIMLDPQLYYRKGIYYRVPYSNNMFFHRIISWSWANGYFLGEEDENILKHIPKISEAGHDLFIIQPYKAWTDKTFYEGFTDARRDVGGYAAEVVLERMLDTNFGRTWESEVTAMYLMAKAAGSYETPSKVTLSFTPFDVKFNEGNLVFVDFLRGS